MPFFFKQLDCFGSNEDNKKKLQKTANTLTSMQNCGKLFLYFLPVTSFDYLKEHCIAKHQFSIFPEVAEHHIIG